MKIKIRSEIVLRIGEIAYRRNTDVYLVGGYVRDLILGKESNDIDFMVIGDGIGFAGFLSEELECELSAVYKKFGTALLNYKGYKLEFATGRKESYDKNSRKPNVVFAGLEDDLARRDFTINCLAVKLSFESSKCKSVDCTVIDLFGGLTDLKKGIIKTPLDPVNTFDDDPLRIMRGIRFASMFGFSIEEKTFEGMHKMKDRIKDDGVVSQERITTEFLRIMETNKPSIGLELMFLSGVMDVVFPELSAMAGVEQREEYHHKDVFAHSLEVVDNVSGVTNDVWLRLAALFHDVGKPRTKRFVEKQGWTFYGHSEFGARMVKKIFNRMKLPLNKLPYVEKLIRMHLRLIPLAEDNVTDSAFRRVAADAGEELEDLLKLCRADITSKNPEKMRKFLSNYEKVERRIVEVQEKDNLRSFQSPVRGEEIMEVCGLKPSKTVGKIKKAIEDAILDGVIGNNYEEAKSYLLKVKDNFLNTNEGKNDKI